MAFRPGNESIMARNASIASTAVIFAGGLGTRMREETEFRPKPMVHVGGRPILWHIMKTYSSFGVSNFVILAGYKGEMIKDYFLNYAALQNDFTIKLGTSSEIEFHGEHDELDWTVTVLDTGAETLTGARLLQAKRFLGDSSFFCTYGDGLADIDLGCLSESHHSSQAVATVSVASPPSRFGLLEFGSENEVIGFREKPVVDDWVNIGFFLFEPSVFHYLDEDSALESDPLVALVNEGQLNAYKHSGFWQPMDTIRDRDYLEELWKAGAAPWQVWD